MAALRAWSGAVLRGSAEAEAEAAVGAGARKRRALRMGSLAVRQRGVDGADPRTWGCNGGVSPLGEHANDGLTLTPYEAMFVPLSSWDDPEEPYGTPAEYGRVYAEWMQAAAAEAGEFPPLPALLAAARLPPLAAADAADAAAASTSHAPLAGAAANASDAAAAASGDAGGAAPDAGAGGGEQGPAGPSAAPAPSRLSLAARNRYFDAGPRYKLPAVLLGVALGKECFDDEHFRQANPDLGPLPGGEAWKCKSGAASSSGRTGLPGPAAARPGMGPRVKSGTLALRGAHTPGRWRRRQLRPSVGSGTLPPELTCSGASRPPVRRELESRTSTDPLRTLGSARRVMSGAGARAVLAQSFQRGVEAQEEGPPVAIKLINEARLPKSVLATLREVTLSTLLSSMLPTKAWVPIVCHVALARHMNDWSVGALLVMERGKMTLEEYMRSMWRQLRPPAGAALALPGAWIKGAMRPTMHLLLSATMLRLCGVYHRDLKPANVLVMCLEVLKLVVGDLSMSRAATTTRAASYTDTLMSTHGFVPVLEFLQPHLWPGEAHGLSLEEVERLRAAHTFLDMLPGPAIESHLAHLVPEWRPFARSTSDSPTEEDLRTPTAFLCLLALVDMKTRFRRMVLTVTTEDGQEVAWGTLGELLDDLCRRLYAAIRTKALSEESPPLRDAFDCFESTRRVGLPGDQGAAQHDAAAAVEGPVHGPQRLPRVEPWQAEACIDAVLFAVAMQQRRLANGEESVIGQLLQPPSGDCAGVVACGEALAAVLEAHVLLRPVDAAELLAPLLQQRSDGRWELPLAGVFFTEWAAWLALHDARVEALRRLPAIVKAQRERQQPLTAAVLKMPHLSSLLRTSALAMHHGSKGGGCGGADLPRVPGQPGKRGRGRHAAAQRHVPLAGAVGRAAPKPAAAVPHGVEGGVRQARKQVDKAAAARRAASQEAAAMQAGGGGPGLGR